MYWSVYSTVPSLQVRGLRWNLKETSANRVPFSGDVLDSLPVYDLELPLDSVR